MYRKKLFSLTFPTGTYIPIMRLDGRNEIIHYGINNDGKNLFIDECVIFDSKKRPVFRYSDSLGYLYTRRIFGENLVAIIIYKNNNFISISLTNIRLFSPYLRKHYNKEYISQNTVR